MSNITDIMSKNHTDCDEIFAQVEREVDNLEWDKATTDFISFVDAMEKHFGAEENILFPTFEERTGQTMGPTQVMRMEHKQIRQLFEEMQICINNRDRDEYLGLSETLLMLMRQHNMKEEQMLYPMADQVLSADAEEIISRMGI
jgi:hemerythrin-like domain-containing protein